jgi:hypothetical protein
MHNISSRADLEDAIRFLEIEQAEAGQLLKDQFHITYESLKPVNILMDTLEDIRSTPNLVDNLVGTVVGLTTGFLSKKIFVGRSGNIFRRLSGGLIQIGVSNLVANHPDLIKSIGQFIFQNILRKKELNSEKQ